MFVSTYVGSLVDKSLRAHAIVNASNPHCGLGSGVSGAIAEACGPGFQREVREAWEDQFDEPLEPEDCVVSGAGIAAAFDWVLHVASVDYTKPDPDTGGPTGPRRVAACTRAALDAAADLAKDNAHDIPGFVLGVPLLGAGHGGLGPVLSVAVMMEAIAGSRSAQELACVRIAVLDAATPFLVDKAAERYGVPRG